MNAINDRDKIKDKLTRIIRDMVVSNPGIEIPQSVEDYFLGTLGWSSENDLNSDDINDFVKNLEQWIVNSNKKSNDCVDVPQEKNFDLSQDFEKYLEAESKYSEVASKVVQLLEDLIKHKEKYSIHFKNKCKHEENTMEVLEGKFKFLKLQFFLKLYGEGNALNGHVKLREKLKAELDVLQRTYSDALENNEKYDEIKTDKNFIELFKIYKELKKIEKRDEIIEQM